jgi:hypothetical protein
MMRSVHVKQAVRVNNLETSQIAHCPLFDKEARLKATASGRLVPEILPLQAMDVTQKVP